MTMQWLMINLFLAPTTSWLARGEERLSAVSNGHRQTEFLWIEEMILTLAVQTISVIGKFVQQRWGSFLQFIFQHFKKHFFPWIPIDYARKHICTIINSPKTERTTSALWKLGVFGSTKSKIWNWWSCLRSSRRHFK